jgi:hypothetical protein
MTSSTLSGRPYLRRLEGGAFEISRRRDVKLILPLASLAGALTLLFGGWGAGALSYL